MIKHCNRRLTSSISLWISIYGFLINIFFNSQPTQNSHRYQNQNYCKPAYELHIPLGFINRRGDIANKQPLDYISSRNIFAQPCYPAAEPGFFCVRNYVYNNRIKN